MNSRKNAKLTARGREKVIRRMGEKPAATVAAGFGISLRTASKWMSHYRQRGAAALADKSSRPKRCRNKLTKQDISRIWTLRKERLTGDEIALRLGFCRSGVFHALCRPSSSRLSSLEEKLPALRYQWENRGKCFI